MNSSSEKEISSDPFAADIFAEHKQSVSTTPEIDENSEEKLPLWTKLLPRANASPIDWISLKNNLSYKFFDELPAHLSKALGNLLNLPDANLIEIVFLVQREIVSPENLEAENSWWLEIGIENSRTEIFLEIDEAFAIWLIDAMLGEEISDSAEKVRNLSASEQAVLEFLSLNLAYEANLALETPVFKFRFLKRQIPASLTKKLTAENSSLLVTNWQVVHQLLPSIVRIYLTPEALKSLTAEENKLLDTPEFRRFQQRNLARRIKDLRMRLALGNVELAVSEFAAAELHDIILLEKNNFVVADGNLAGRAEIFLGDAENLQISGEILTEDSVAPPEFEEKFLNDDNKLPVKTLRFVRPLRIMIESFTESEFPAVIEESMAEPDENLEDDSIAEPLAEQNGLAIENLAVTLRVELEARRLPLSEVGNLSENQVLELGIRPTDTVNILIDNKLVGRGELVIVEQRLGVRITKLLR